MMEQNNNNLRRDDGPQLSPQSGKQGPNLGLIAALILAAFIVVFVLKNSAETTIDFMVFDWHTTVRWSIFIAVILGIVLDRLVGFWWRRRGNAKAKATKQKDD